MSAEALDVPPISRESAMPTAASNFAKGDGAVDIVACGDDIDVGLMVRIRLSWKSSTPALARVVSLDVVAIPATADLDEGTRLKGLARVDMLLGLYDRF